MKHLLELRTELMETIAKAVNGSDEVLLYNTPEQDEEYMEDEAWCTLPSTPFYYRDLIYDGTIYALSSKDDVIYVSVFDENSDIEHTVELDELYVDQLFELKEILNSL